MIEQEITIRTSENPFDTTKIKVHVPRGIKLLSTESYTLESLGLYGISTNIEENSKLCESKESYITRGEIILISKDKAGNKESALVDVGSKFTAFCSLQKEHVDIVDQLEVGMSIDVRIKTLSNGTIVASISEAIDEVKSNEILNSIGDNTVAFNGKITELINGGYWVNISGIKCFMPGSLAGLNKLWDFDSLVGQELIVMPVSFSYEKNTIIVSHREYLKTLIPNEIDYLQENIKTPLIGHVTGTTKFGVFAEFNKCLTGLIPNTELDEETLLKYERNEIKPGDNITFWAKEIINNRKIILTQKGPKEDLWDNVNERYKPTMIVTGTVTKVVSYGAFVELEKGISGLIHKTKLKDISLQKGDVINVKILGVNSSDRKITMTLADNES